MTNQTDTQSLKAALSMLESGRGVPVRMDLMPNAKARWMRFDWAISQRQSEIEFGSPSPRFDEILIEDIGNAVAAVNTLLRIGVPSADDQVRVGVAYKDAADWFEKTRAAWNERAPHDVDQLMTAAHICYQAGAERIYDIDENVIEIPELSDVGGFPLDDQAVARRLRDIVTERLGLPETPQRQLPPAAGGLELC